MIANAVAPGYSIDSRTIRPGELFFAVKGERMDGHDFVAQALEKGAVAAVVCKGEAGDAFQSRSLGWSPVRITLDSRYRRLAKSVRDGLWGKPLIAVTGSAGKTTTKEAIAHVLASRFRVLKSEGNFNNHFGLPLMLLKLGAGARRRRHRDGDVACRERLRRWRRLRSRKSGVVTNVAPVHLEFFNSVAEIARAKYELIESLPATGTAVLNADDEYVSQFGRDFNGKVVTYGFAPVADVRAENLKSLGAAGSAFDLVVGEPA